MNLFHPRYPPFSLVKIPGSSFHIIAGTPFLYQEKKQLLVMGDLHLGHEAYINQTGGIIPFQQASDILLLISKIHSLYSLQTILLNGDIKHGSRNVIRDEKRELHSFFSQLRRYQIIIIEGNHDNNLSLALQEFSNITFSPSYYFEFEQTLISHGHSSELIKLVNSSNHKEIILSHEHPAYKLPGLTRHPIKVPCFLIGFLTTKQRVIVLPAASMLALGTSVNHAKSFLSPVLNQFLVRSSLEYYLVDREIGCLVIA